jgi:hypothetical protein
MTVPFDVYMGTLVTGLVTGEVKGIDYPYSLVTVLYDENNLVIPHFLIASFREFEEAAEEMDDIQIDGDFPWSLTVLSMSTKGSTVVWSDMLPMTPATQ